MIVADKWKDYEVLDTGDGEKLERWGNHVLRRPDPQTIWPKAREEIWADAEAMYHRSERGGGSWEFRTRLPERWIVSHGKLRFYVKPTGFKHTGLFPEQAVNWDYLRDVITGSGRAFCAGGDLNVLMDIFAQAAGNTAIFINDAHQLDNVMNLDESRVRDVDYLQADVFCRYHTETEMMRYLKRLDRKDISLTHSMIPLGSCTMKLNPATAMIPISYAGFGGIHPMAPTDQTEGYNEMLSRLKQQLCVITGFDGCSLQPTSGAAGEYAGLVVIRDFLHHQGQGQRRTLLIPASAHGTNPASCVQAGFEPVVVRCDEGGNTDLADWQQKAEQHADTLAGCMITYPSTHGIFERDIRRMIDIIHQNGGQVYMDGANMNAQVGLTSPAKIGADVCHLNFHKTFAGLVRLRPPRGPRTHSRLPPVQKHRCDRDRRSQTPHGLRLPRSHPLVPRTRDTHDRTHREREPARTRPIYRRHAAHTPRDSRHRGRTRRQPRQAHTPGAQGKADKGEQILRGRDPHQPRRKEKPLQAEDTQDRETN